MARVSRKNNDYVKAVATRDDQELRIFKTALYARLSVEDNGKNGDSLEAQIRYCIPMPSILKLRSGRINF